MPQRAVQAPGEIALRVQDLNAMHRFYEEGIGRTSTGHAAVPLVLAR